MIRTLVKWLAIAVVCLGLLTIAMLKIVERSPDQLKVGFESYLTQLSGYPAEIGELRRVAFFPSFDIDARRVRLWPMDDPDGRVLYAQAVTVKVPLWSLLLGRPRFADLSVSGVQLDGALTGAGDVEIGSITFDRARDLLTASGRVGEVAIEASMPVRRVSAGKELYTVPRPPVRISGTLESGASLKGDFFIDFNRDQYGALATFSAYDPARLRPLQQLLEKALAGKGERAFAVQLHIEQINGRAGPYVVESVRLENGRLQPPECFFNNRGHARGGRHPCASYFTDTHKASESTP